MEMLDKGVIHVPGGMEQDSMGFHHTTEVCNLKLSNCLFLDFSFNNLEGSLPWVIKTVENKSVDKGALLHVSVEVPFKSLQFLFNSKQEMYIEIYYGQERHCSRNYRNCRDGNTLALLIMCRISTDDKTNI